MTLSMPVKRWTIAILKSVDFCGCLARSMCLRPENMVRAIFSSGKIPICGDLRLIFLFSIAVLNGREGERLW